MKMKNKLPALIVLIIIILFVAIPVLKNNKKAVGIVETGIETLAENLDTVWAIDFLPNGKMIFTERPGRVNIYDSFLKYL